MNTRQYSAIQILSHGPVIPVIVINQLAQAVPLARALVAGGIPSWRLRCAPPVRWMPYG